MSANYFLQQEVMYNSQIFLTRLSIFIYIYEIFLFIDKIYLHLLCVHNVLGNTLIYYSKKYILFPMHKDLKA